MNRHAFQQVNNADEIDKVACEGETAPVDPRRDFAVDLHPELFDAMTALAEAKGLPLPTLVTVVLHTGLSVLLARRRRSVR